MTSSVQPGVASKMPRQVGADTVTALTVYVVLLFAVPSNLRILALGSAGTLSGLWAMACGLWWCWIHLQRPTARRGLAVHPVRAISFVVLGCVVASYVAAMARPIPAIEASQADVGLLRMAASVSILLLAADALPSMDRLVVLLRRVTWLGAALAALGLAQFATGRALVDGIAIPGMVSTQDFSGVSDRGGFIRAAGTAMSPLEYGAALSTVMPIALTFALYGRPSKYRWVSFVPAAVMAAALLVSGSRSSLVGLAVGVIVMMPAWSARIRAVVVAAGIAGLVAVFFLVPGMIGTLRYLFTNTSTDSSTRSRSNSYDLVAEFFFRAPVFGRGFGTFLPQYRILDNEYLLLLIEIGLVGLLVVLTLIVTAATCAIVSRKLVADPLHSQLGQALAAGLLSAATLTGFFDALSFPIAAGCLFFAIGLCGGYWRLSHTVTLSQPGRAAV